MLGRGGGNDLSSTSICLVFMLGGFRYCTFEILIANPIDGRPESNYFVVNVLTALHVNCMIDDAV
jgi:hypothetical protein